MVHGTSIRLFLLTIVFALAGCTTWTNATCEKEKRPSGTTSDSAATTATHTSGSPYPLGLRTYQEESSSPKSSGLYLKDYDSSARVQDDLFKSTNGRWLERTQIPDDRSNYGRFSELADAAEKNLKEIILDARAGRIDHPMSDLIGQAYASYLNTDAISKKGLQEARPFFEALAEIQSHDELASYFGKVSRFGIDLPFGMWIDQDKTNPQEYRIYVTQSGLGLPDKSYYEDATFEPQRNAYRSYLKTLRSYTGQDSAIGDFEDKSVYALEVQLAAIQWERQKRRERDLVYNPLSLQAMQEYAPQFRWNRYFDAAEIKNSDDVVLREKDYFQKFAKLFQNTPVGVWKDYLRVRIVDDIAPYLSEPWSNAHFNFHGTALSGVPTQRPRWKRAVSFVENTLGEALGQLYVQRHFPPVAKQKMEVLVRNLLATYNTRIRNLDWMSDATKEKALEKLSKFTPKIGYPNKWKSYQGLVIKADDLLGNMLESALYEHRREIRKLGQPINREEWFMPPQMVNAYYNAGMNEIVFPAAILQPPFFDWNADDAVNYGGIGAVIGHEISHGFDDQGRKSDGDGRQVDWWSAEDAKRFKERSEKLVAQYSSYEALQGKYVNGQLTLGENIADLGGLTVAVEAYLSATPKWEEKIDGYDGLQRVFLSWGQIWARKYRDAELLKRLKTDPHSPSQFRVNGVVVNMDRFHEAFDTTQGDQLYTAPESRVKVW